MTLDISTLLLQKHPGKPANAEVVAKMLDSYGSQVAYAVSVRDLNVLESYYQKASLIPKTATMDAFGLREYILNGPLHGNENVIVCFDKNAKPHLLKRMNNEDEIHRVRIFAAASILNDHIMPFEVKGTHDNDACMLMPFYPATLTSLSLSHFVHGHGDTSLVEKLIGQMSVALEAMHSQDFCHMDIKPSNIAIDCEGNFVLIDVGSVAMVGEVTEATDLFLPKEDGGTYGRYVATEKRDWLMLALTVYSKVNDAWNGKDRVSQSVLDAFVQSTSFMAPFKQRY